jgi:endonuclease/exonuclease/phosphatase family metal-dependent hydrolase
MTAPGARFFWWNLQGPGAERMRRQLELIRRELDPLPDVLAFAEVLASSADALREELPDYTVIAPDGDLHPKKRRSALAIRGDAEALPTAERFQVPERHHIPEARGFRIWPRSIVSARTELAGQPVEVHAVHIPNGSSNGWVKIDHLWALRYGLERSTRPQIVGSDLNAPQGERDGEIVTFGQERDGSFSDTLKTDPPYTLERPWSSRPWDEGERAVLEGLPRELDMADAYRELDAEAPGFTWGPRGGDPDRRLDHVFVSRQLQLRSCEHLERWRGEELSDHVAVLASIGGASA